MYQNLKNNKNVIFVAVVMFLVSVGVIMMVSNPETSGHLDGKDLKADVINILDDTDKDELEEKYRAYLDFEEGPFLILGLDGMVKFASEDYEEMSGYEEGELDEHMIFTNINPLDLPRLVASFGEVLASGKPKTMVGPYKIMNADEEFRTHVATLHPIMNEDKVVEVAVMPKDITDVIIDEQEAENENADEDANEAETVPPGKPIRNLPDNEEHRLADNNLV